MGDMEAWEDDSLKKLYVEKHVIVAWRLTSMFCIPVLLSVQNGPGCTEDGN